jgi:hypothetical protein
VLDSLPVELSSTAAVVLPEVAGQSSLHVVSAPLLDGLDVEGSPESGPSLDSVPVLDESPGPVAASSPQATANKAKTPTIDHGPHLMPRSSHDTSG